MLGKMNQDKKRTMAKNQLSGTTMHKSKSSSNPYRADPAGGKKGSQFRTRSTIKRLNMYTQKPNIAKMKLQPTDPAAGRIQPDRRWFGNVRTVDQKELDKYRKSLEDKSVKKGSGYSILLKGKKMPLSLVKDQFDKTLSKGERLLQIESYSDTFGPKMKRKRPNLAIANLE